MVEIATRDHGEITLSHLVKNVATTRDFPRIETRFKLFAAIPKMVALLLDKARPDRMGRDGNGALRPNAVG